MGSRFMDSSTAMDSCQGSHYSADKNRAGAGAQGFIRTTTRSDAVDIFTMSPLGSPVDSAAQPPSSPQMCLSNSQALSIDIGYHSVENSFQDNIHNHAQSSHSTPNSPRLFSFSPALHSGSRGRNDMHYGGSSYDTDMTSLVGSWGSNSGIDFAQTMEPVSSGQDKGKNVVREMVDDHVSIEDAMSCSKIKGKGKAIDVPSSSGLSHRFSFEFDFEFGNTQDVDSGSNHKGSYGDIQEGLFEAPVVRLSPVTQYGDFRQDTELYAGALSRNGEGRPQVTDVEEEITALFDSSPMFPRLESHPSSPPVSPSPNGPRVPTRVPKHRQSLSSVSLRSIKSSSSRSIASIRSTLTAGNICGKIRSVAPAAKKLKGGLRKMFSLNAIRTGTTLATSEFNSDHANDSNRETNPINGEQPVHTSSIHDTDTEADDLYSHEEGLSTESNQQGHPLEASIISDATVGPFSTGKTLMLSDNGMEDSTGIVVVAPRTMSHPMAFTRYANIADEERFNHVVFDKVQSPASQIAVNESMDYFGEWLPREIQLAVLKSVVDINESMHREAVNGNSPSILWSVTTAGKSPWVGREKGWRELIKFSRVSKSWQALALDGQLWRNLRLMSPYPRLSSALLLRLAEHAGSFVQSLDLRGWTHLNPVVLRGLIRSLSINPASNDLPGALQPAASLAALSFPPTCLTSVSLRACTALTAHSLHHVLLRAPSLRSVDLHGLTAVTNSTCGVLSAYCPKLETTDLGRCVNLDGDGIRELFDGVSLARSWVNEDGTSSVIFPRVINKDSRGSYSKLKVLRVSGIKRLDAGALAVLAVGAPALEVLDLSYSRDLTDDAISAFVAWDNSWDIPLTNDLGDDESILRRKVELTAREMGRDPTLDIGPFYKRITHLRHLNLSSCPLLTDQTCTHLAYCVPRLEFLELAGIGPDMGDEGLVRLFNTTPYIRRVDLEDASEVSDAVIDALTPKLVTEVAATRRGVFFPPPQPGHNLQYLIISYGLSITNEALLSLIQACPCLTVLECDNTRVSGAVVKAFVNMMRNRGMPNAEIVAVDCRGVNEALVKDLAAKGLTRPRKGYRHYDARTLGYVDARDKEDFSSLNKERGGNIDIDDCDDMRVALKSFWSWQGVDMVQQVREKRRRMALSRRNTDSGILGSRHAQDEQGALSDDDSAGPSVRPRWLGQWTRGSGTHPSSSTTPTSLIQDERGCILM